MKLRITETQLNTIKKTLNEGVENQYNRQVKLSYYYHGVNLRGREIADIADNSVNLVFNIELEGRSWGIKDISVSGIKGPSDVELEMQYYDETEELQDANTTISLNWDMATINKMSGHGVITVGDDVEITLINDQNGEIIVKSIEVTVYSA